MSIRTAVVEDLEKIVSIHNQAIRQGKTIANLHELTVHERMHWFEQHSFSAYPIWVAELVGEIVGWCCLSPYRPGRLGM